MSTNHRAIPDWLRVETQKQIRSAESALRYGDILLLEQVARSLNTLVRDALDRPTQHSVTFDDDELHRLRTMIAREYRETPAMLAKGALGALYCRMGGDPDSLT